MKEKGEIKLWLVWKDPNTRQRFVVGRLWYDFKYYFQYFQVKDQNGINNFGLDLAEEFGFRKLEPFQDLHVYSNRTLFQVFNRRLPDRTRPDFDILVKEYRLNPDCTPLELLEATGGRLATDTLEFVTPFTFEESGKFDIDFYIAGWRYYNGESIFDELKNGTPLKLSLDPTNQYDPFAIKVLGPGDVMLGYVPVYYSRYLDEVVKNNNYQAHVERTGALNNPQIRVLINVQGVVSSLANVVKQIDQRIKSLAVL
jgi:hypothetical protein